MGREIDEKVVSMQFDNAQFEKNVAQSMSTIDRLKEKLKFSDSSKGLEEISQTANNMDFSRLYSSIDGIASRFSTMGVVSMTVISNITTSVMSSIKQIASSIKNLTVQGGISRAMNIEAAKFSLEGLGIAWEKVDKQITFAVNDTAYGLDAAAKAASTLAASGVAIGNVGKELTKVGKAGKMGTDYIDDMGMALKAISGVAAQTNSDYESISSIFSTVAGQGKLMTMQLRQLETRGLNVAAKMGEVLGKSEAQVRDMIGKGKIDFATFSKTMYELFADHASKANETLTGVTANIRSAFAKIGALFVSPLVQNGGPMVQMLDSVRAKVNEFKDALADSGIVEEFSKAQTASFKKLKKTIDLLNSKNGATLTVNIIHGLVNVLKGLGSALSPIKKAYQEIFNKNTSDEMLSFGERFEALTSKFKMGEETSENLKRTFKGVFALLDIGATLIKDIVKNSSPLLGAVSSLGNGLVAFTGNIGDFLVSVDEALQSTDKFNAVLERFKSILDPIATGVRNFANSVCDSFSNISWSMEGLTPIEILAKGIGAAFTILGRIINGIRPAIKAITDTCSKLWSQLADTFYNSELATNALNTGIAFFLWKLAIQVKNIIKLISDGWNPFKKIVSTIDMTLGDLDDALIQLQNNLRADSLMKIAKAVAILAGALWLLCTLDEDKLSGAIGAIGALAGILVASFAIFNKYSGLTLNAEGGVLGVLKNAINGFAKAESINIMANAIIKMASAVAVLAIAVKILSDLSWEELAKGLTGVTILLAELTAVTLILSKQEGKILKGMTSLVVMAAAINILASAVKELGSIDLESLLKGLLGVTVLLGEVTVVVKLLSKDTTGKMVSVGIGLIAVASALKILANVAKDFASMTWEGLAKAGVAISGLLTVLTLFVKFTSGSKKMISIGTSMVILGASMKIFASAMNDFGSLGWDKIGKGLTAMGGALTEIVIAMRLMPKNMISTSIGLAIVAGSLTILADAMASFGSLSWEEIGKGLTSLAGSMIILSIALNTMKTSLAGSAALLVACVALNALVPVLTNLGKMSWDEIGKGLLTLAAGLTIIGIAGYALAPVAGTLLSIGAAATLLGVGCAAVGAGAVLLGAGLTAIAGSVVAACTAIIAGLNILICGILDLDSSIVRLIGVAITTLCKAITDSANAIGEAFLAVINVLLDVIMKSVPKIVDCALTLILTVLDSLVEYTPKIIDTLATFIIKVIEGIGKNVPRIIKAAIRVFGKVFDGILDSLGNMNPDDFIKALSAIGLLAGVIYALAAVAPMTPVAMAGAVGAAAVIAELGLLLAAVGGLAQIPGLKWLIDESSDFMESIGRAIGGLVGGVIGGIGSGITSSLPSIATNLSTFMTEIQPFINGVKSVDSSVLSNVISLTEMMALLSAASIMESIASWLGGGSSLTEFANQLVPFGEAIVGFSNTISGKIDSKAIDSAANAGKTLAEMASTLPNSGGVVEFFTGSNDMSIFTEQLVPFGEAMAAFSDTVAGKIDPESITSAANAGKTLVELAKTVPNSGGVVEFFTGGNDLSSFSEQLLPFGEAMVEFSSVVSEGIDSEAVTAAANAGSIMVELADKVPNTGGVVGFFAGNNDLDTFGESLIPFGESIVKFSETVAGNIDSEAITAAANAGSIMVELADKVPNTGGVVDFFTGSNDLGTFGNQLVIFGESIAEFSESISGKIDIPSVTAAALAGQMMADMSGTIPKSGGVVGFFTGSHDMSKFATGLVPFGEAISKFSTIVSGKINSGAVVAAANAGKTLAEMQTTLPSTGGVIDFVTGHSMDMASFAEGLVPFGEAIVKFSSVVSEGIDSTAVTAAANAGKAMAEMQSTLPSTGGVVEFFTGHAMDMASFSSGLVPFGEAIVKFSSIVAGNIDEGAVTAAANAGKTMAEMQETLPETGGVFEMFTGSRIDMASFSEQLVPFGEAMADFSKVVSGNIDEGAITAAANAGNTMAEMQDALPSIGGVVEFFTGTKMSMSEFGEQMKSFGDAMVKFSESVSGNIDEGAITAAANAGKAIAEIQAALPEEGGFVGLFKGEADMENFSSDVESFGGAIANFDTKIQNVHPDKIRSATNAAKDISNIAIDTKFIDPSNLTALADAIPSLGTAMSKFDAEIKNINTETLAENTQKFKGVIDNLHAISKKGMNDVSKVFVAGQADSVNAMGDVITAVESTIKSNSNKIGDASKELMSAFNKSISDNDKDATTKISTVLTNMKSTIDKQKSSFTNAGKNLVLGFIDGIDSEINNAAKKAAEMARASKTAAEKELDEHSPSKVFYKIGAFAGQGLVNAFGDYESKSYASGKKLANSATKGVGNAISKIKDIIESGIDTEPTIRPVLDMSNITSGSSAINRMLSGNPYYRLATNAGIINMSMNNKGNEMSNADVVDAIDKLRRDISDLQPNVTNINGITYDDGSNIHNMIGEIVHAAKIERRM